MKKENGITLIALIITIIILLILAGISIALLTGENGILTKADISKQETIKQGAKEKIQVEVMGSYDNNGKINLEELNNNLKKNIEGLMYNGSQISADNKIEALPIIVFVDGYNVKIHENGNVTIERENLTPPTPVEPEIPKTVEEAKKTNEPLSITENTTITDDFGNQVVVPAGFKIGSDSSTNVTGGIVIEDVNHTTTAGSEFVWIPVGTIYTNKEKTESKTINLSRYTFAQDGTATVRGDETIIINYKTDFNGTNMNVSFSELAESTLGNTSALNIGKFKELANKNDGYYIGRYEARTAIKEERTAANQDDNAQVTVRKKDYIYNYITQPKAAQLSQAMYNEPSNFTSDLINSYAWDTAIVFMQTFDNRINPVKPYSRQYSLYTSLANQGTNNLTESTNQDQICNIFDMASNLVEWSTETSISGGLGPYTYRGSWYGGNTYAHSTIRYGETPTKAVPIANGFRVILYINQIE